VKDKTLSLLLAIWMISVAFVGLAATVKADDNYINSTTRIYINDNNYPDPSGSIPNDWFAPGDTITGRLAGWTTGIDALEDVLDVVVGDDDPLTPGCDQLTDFNSRRLWADNVALDPDEGSFTLVGATLNPTQYMRDGPYCAWVAPGDYIEQAGAVPHYVGNGRSDRFYIHLYQILVSTDKSGYIPGDTVKVSYTVSNIRNGSLIKDNVDVVVTERKWAVQSDDRRTDTSSLLTGATGSFQFVIANDGGVNWAVYYPTYIWYNGTSGGATREAVQSWDVQVGNIGIYIDAPSFTSVQTPDTLLTIETTSYAIADDGSTELAMYPGAAVEIKLLNGASANSPTMPGYPLTFTSDGTGETSYTFLLDPSSYLDGKTYRINATASKTLQQGMDWAVFDVRAVPPSMIVDIKLDRASYMSEETATATVTAMPPAGHGAPSTFVYEVFFDNPNPPYDMFVFYREVSASGTLTFQIPETFSGDLTFMVDAYNTQGDYGRDAITAGVHFGFLIVNANPEEYQAGSDITVSFNLESQVMEAATTKFFYRVCQSYCGSGVDMEEGPLTVTGMSGSFVYKVPDVPASDYEFEVTANDEGRSVSGSYASSLLSGFIISVTFDKATYQRGETASIEYTITPRSENSELPRVFYLSYHFLGNPSKYVETTAASGKVTYVVPGDANEGVLLFYIYESSTGAYTYESVRIGPAPSEISLFDAFLLVLIVILFLLVLAMRGRGAGAGAGAPKPKEEKAAPPPPPGQQVSPMIVNCKACGAPIELTTSKRPIEVMCPSCGETAMVQ